MRYLMLELAEALNVRIINPYFMLNKRLIRSSKMSLSPRAQRVEKWSDSDIIF